jgi:stage II sporulation protein D
MDLRTVALCGVLATIVPAANCTPRTTDNSSTAPHEHVPLALRADGSPMVRVLLRSDANGAALAISGPFQIRQNSQIIFQGPELPRTKIRVDAGDPQHFYLGRHRLPVAETIVLPQKPGTLVMHLPTADGPARRHRYNGYGVIAATKNQAAAPSVELINVVSVEQYLPGVLTGELFPSFHEEAFKTQAIAARTYVLYEMITVGKNRHYDVRASEASQVYRGIDGLDPSSKPSRATLATRGLVCTWNSPMGPKIFCTYYSSACGGMTQKASNCMPTRSIPPLGGGVRCDYCKVGSSYRWGPERISKSELTERVVARYPALESLGQIRTITAQNLTADGRPLKLQLTGESGEQFLISSYAFRLAIDGHRIRSNHCKIVDLGHDFEFRDGRGFGHAVGMCQWGVEGQSRHGAKAADMLGFYYPQSSVTRAY